MESSDYCKVCRKNRVHESGLDDKIYPGWCKNCSNALFGKQNSDSRLDKHVSSPRCLICHSTFSSNSALNVHVRIHLGEKRHGCPACSKCFSQKQQLDRHFKALHTEEWYQKLPTAIQQKTKSTRLANGRMSQNKLDSLSNVVTYDLKNKCFCAKKFLHKSNKLISLLPFANALGDFTVRAAMKSKLGDLFQAKIQRGMQLQLVSNVKKGSVIKVVSESAFPLPFVTVYQAHSSFFTSELISQSIPHMSKFCKNGKQPKTIALELNNHITDDKVLRMRVSPSEINTVRKLWPLIWQKWDRINLWTYGNEKYNYFPHITKRKVSIQAEIGKLIQLAGYDISTLDNDIHSSLVVNYILLCSQPENNVTLKAFLDNASAEARDFSLYDKIGSLLGFSSIVNLPKSVFEEVGLVVNFVVEPVSLEEYISNIRLKTFQLNGKNVQVVQLDVNGILELVEQVAKLGFVSVTKRNKQGFFLVPTVPECLRSIVRKLILVNEEACFQSVLELIKDEKEVELLISFLSTIFSTPDKRKTYLPFIAKTKKCVSKKTVTFNPSFNTKTKTILATSVSVLTSFSSKNVSRKACQFCDKTFTNVSNLNQHVKSIHSKVKPLECVFCLSKFPRKGALEYHLMTHVEEKPYSCALCNSGFRESRKLASHKRLHTSVKPFKCLICHRSYCSKSGLKKHQRQHEPEKNQLFPLELNLLKDIDAIAHFVL